MEKFTLNILKILTQKDDSINTIKEILWAIKDFTKVDYATVKMKEDYLSEGKHLTCANNDSTKEFTIQYTPCYKINSICVNVLKGNIDKRLKCFTNNGSFWTNDAISFFSKNKNIEHIECDACQSRGYRSILIIPLRIDNKIIAILQLCDVEKNFFTKERVALFEGLAESMSIAINRKLNLERLAKNTRILRESTKELRKSNKELEQFAYITSHDLQEPLRVVASYCQLIKEFIEENCQKDLTSEEKEEIDKYIGFTIDATYRMKALIQDLLEFSRVGRVDNSYSMVNLNNVLKDILNDFEITTKEYNINIECQNLPQIPIKERRIGQVFHNLISNAIKFRKENVLTKIKIGYEEKENEYIFFVSDNGVGINNKYLDRIFGLFKRLYTRQEYPGTGIGLALVKKIVENHKGRIWVESEIDKGSTFYFTIPRGEILEN